MLEQTLEMISFEAQKRLKKKKKKKKKA